MLDDDEEDAEDAEDEDASDVLRRILGLSEGKFYDQIIKQEAQ